MSNPDVDVLMPALEKLPPSKVRELLFFLVGWCDGNQYFIDGLRHWLETEPS